MTLDACEGDVMAGGRACDGFAVLVRTATRIYQGEWSRGRGRDAMHEMMERSGDGITFPRPHRQHTPIHVVMCEMTSMATHVNGLKVIGCPVGHLSRDTPYDALVGRKEANGGGSKRIRECACV